MADCTKKILIRGVNWIGDAVLTLPAVRAVRVAYPDAYISLLVKPWGSGIFEESPDINEIIIYEDRFNTAAGKFKLAKILRAKKFDMAILLQNAFDAALVAWLSGIPARIGYGTDCRSLLLTKIVTVQRSAFSVQRKNGKKITRLHQVYYYLNLLKEALNIEPCGIEPYIYLKKDEAYEARNLLNSSFILHPSSLIIGINPGAAYGSAKRWVPKKFAGLIRRIIVELNGNVILFGSKSELEITDEIIRLVNGEQSAPGKKLTVNSPLPFSNPLRITHYASRILNLAGKTSLRQLAALISECDAFITNDSGPMHIASAMSVPLVAIFGSTDPNATGPLGARHKVISKELSCSPCLKRKCPEGHLNCMEAVNVDDVFNALTEVLPKERAVFLDRDGTIIEDANYLNSFDRLKILPDIPESLMKLKSAGFKLIGITNQSGIARGIVSKKFVKESNAYLQKTLGIDAFYYCPHHPDDNCICRKPETRLLRKARSEHGVNLKASYMIGDKPLDALAARQAGAKGILLLKGSEDSRGQVIKGSSTTAQDEETADYVAVNFKEAVKWILEQKD
ncbi:MAG: HAD-IIIA family hydrolase [Nitrospirae bacterium]|nr:HAD-IIIA family hydrolase [Nitrospirota bacterium]